VPDGRAQDAGDAQRKLLRLERLADVIVGADVSPSMRLRASSRAVSMMIGTLEDARRSRASSKPVLARHHDVEDQQIEAQPFELGARIGGGLRVVTR
jgi:hypothetical protein